MPDLPVGASDEDDGRWWACQHPERPPTEQTKFHFDCERCVWMIRAAQNSNCWPLRYTIEDALRWSGPGGKEAFEAERKHAW